MINREIKVKWPGFDANSEKDIKDAIAYQRAIADYFDIFKLLPDYHITLDIGPYKTGYVDDIIFSDKEITCMIKFRVI